MENIAVIFLYPLSKSLRLIFEIIQEKKDPRFTSYEVDTATELTQIMTMCKANIVICSDSKKLIKVQMGHERFFSEKTNKLMITTNKRLTQKEINLLYEKNIQEVFQEPVNEKLLYSKLEFHIKSLETYFKGQQRAEALRKQREADEIERKENMAKRAAEQAAKKALREEALKTQLEEQEAARKNKMSLKENLGSSAVMGDFKDHIGHDAAVKLGEDLISGKLKLVETKKILEQSDVNKITLQNKSELTDTDSAIENDQVKALLKEDHVNDNSIEKIHASQNGGLDQSEVLEKNIKGKTLLNNEAKLNHPENKNFDPSKSAENNQTDQAIKNEKLSENKVDHFDNKNKGVVYEEQKSIAAPNENGNTYGTGTQLEGTKKNSAIDQAAEKKLNSYEGKLEGELLNEDQKEKLDSKSKGLLTLKEDDIKNNIASKELTNEDLNNKIDAKNKAILNSELAENDHQKNNKGTITEKDLDHLSHHLNSSPLSEQDQHLSNLKKSNLTSSEDSNKIKDNAETAKLSSNQNQIKEELAKSILSNTNLNKENKILAKEADGQKEKISKNDVNQLKNKELNQEKTKLNVHSINHENKSILSKNDESKNNLVNEKVIQSEKSSLLKTLKNNSNTVEPLRPNDKNYSTESILNKAKLKNINVIELADIRYKNYDWNKKMQDWITLDEKILKGGTLNKAEVKKMENKIKHSSEIMQDEEAKKIGKNIIHGDLKGAPLAIKILSQIQKIDQKTEEQKFVFELIGDIIFKNFRALTTFYYKDAKQNQYLILHSVHNQHPQLWEEYYLKDWTTYKDKQIAVWKSHQYSKLLTFQAQGKISPEVPEKTFEYLFPIDSPKGVLGFIVVHFHQINLTDIDTMKVESCLEFVRGYFFKQNQITNVGSVSKGSKKTNELIPGDEKKENQVGQVIGKISNKISNLFKWKKAS